MNPREQQQLTMPTVEVFLAIEEQILINAGKSFRRYKNLFNEKDIERWRSSLLLELDNLTQQNVIVIAKNSGLAIDEVSEMLEEAGYKASSNVDSDLKEAIRQGYAVAPPSTSTVLENILLAYQKKAKDTFNMIHTTMLNQSQQAYINVLNDVVGKTLSGTITPQQALREAVGKWAEKGIPALVDKAGKQWSTEAYLNTVTRSMSNNVANDMQFARMDEHEIDLVEVSSHMGARPRCAPFQGKIFSRSGTSKKYPPLDSTSYGEIAGLKGINCGHIFYSFIEGVTIQRNHPYEAEENDIAYKLSQQQRYLEREIRRTKRELNMMSAMGDDVGIQESKKKVRGKQANMRKFIDESGRTRRRDREQLPINNPNVGGGRK